MKITASVTKSLHQDRGPYYLHLPIFFLYIPGFPTGVENMGGCVPPIGGGLFKVWWGAA